MRVVFTKEILDNMIRKCLSVLVISLTLIFVGCREANIPSTNLENVIINGYAVSEGKNDVYDLAITKSDVENELGDSYLNGVYDYSQGFYKMTYHDDVNNITMVFVYLETSNGKIINWIEVNK